MTLYQYIIDYFHESPTIIQLCWGLSIGFIITIFFLISYLKYIRSRLRNKGRIESTYRKKYESDLIEYLYAGNNVDAISPQQQKIADYLRKCAKSSLKRKIIINTLLKLRNEISGETADAIQNLYHQSGLIDQALVKLNDKRWDVVARAIKELTQFEIRVVHDNIKLLVNHPKKEVRNEIQKYLVKLFCFDGLEFLSILENQLSEWDQIQLLGILQKADNPQLPNITNWLRSSNVSVISFTIKLAKIFNQFESKDAILKLLHHPDQEIRIQAIDVIAYLGFFEAIEILKKDLNERSIEEQIAFFKMNEKMCTPADIPFIMGYINHENFDIRQSAITTIELITPKPIKIDRPQNENKNDNNNLIAS